MIVGLRGTVEAKGTDWVYLQVGGVTLQVSVPATAIKDLGSIGDQVHLKPYVVAEDTILGDHTAAGPFAHLRPGTHLEAHAKATMRAYATPKIKVQTVDVKDDVSLIGDGCVPHDRVLVTVRIFNAQGRRSGLSWTGSIPAAATTSDGMVVTTPGAAPRQ